MPNKETKIMNTQETVSAEENQKLNEALHRRNADLANRINARRPMTTADKIDCAMIVGFPLLILAMWTFICYHSGQMQ